MRTFLTPLAGLIAFSAVSQGSVLLQDNFDSYTPASYSNLSTLGTNWTVNGSVDVVGPGFFPTLVVGNETVNAIDLDGTAQGGLTSLLIALAPGNYALIFDLNGSQRGLTSSTTVTLGSFVNATIVQPPSDLSHQVFSFTVGSGTSANLVFTSNTPGNIGALLDNVLLQTVPEPSSVALTLCAAPLLWMFRKRLVRR
jgi:hypothetical protein